MRFLALILFFAFAARPRTPAWAQTDLYSFPEVESSKPKPEEPKPADPFIKTLAKKMDVHEQILAEAAEKGMGRMELIRLILISKKSGKLLPDLIRQIEKLVRFAKIASEAEVDNGAVKKEAKTLLKDLEKETEKAKVPAGTAKAKEDEK